MLEEATILDREYCLDQHLRDLVVGKDFAFARFRGKVVRKYRRFECERFERNAVTRQLRELLTVERHANESRLIPALITRPDLNHNAVRRKTPTPHATRIRFEVTSASQRQHQLLSRPFLSDLKHARRRVQSRTAGQVTSRKPRVDDLGIVGVGTDQRVARECERRQKQKNTDRQQPNTYPAPIWYRY